MEQYFAGPKINTMSDLKFNINKYIDNKNAYLVDFSEKVELLKHNYAGNIHNSCLRYKELIDSIFKK